MAYYRYQSLCLCPMGGSPPPGAEEVSEPFEPLVFLLQRDPLTSRGVFAVRSTAELDEPEGANLLLPAPPDERADTLARFVREHGATALNTSFSRCLSVYQAQSARAAMRPRVNLIGLGDVGGTALTGLVLLGGNLDEIGIFDPDAVKCARYEAELNQILPFRDGGRVPCVRVLGENELFDCDALVFTATRGVPPVGAEAGDVRMAQYRLNRDMLKSYARRARESGFCGLFMVVSDPVDPLCRAVFRMSNQNEAGAFDGNGLLPEQVRGFGLGVMRARALYYAQKEGIDAAAICAFGPHGGGLVIANAPDERYDDALSLRLTKLAKEANLRLREIGVKPYIAPGLSSAAISILRALAGDWHDAAVPLGGAYFGCRVRFGDLGPETLRQPLNGRLFTRIAESWKDLRRLDETWAD